MSSSFATPWTVARQAPLSTGFPRQEYWSGLAFPSPRDLLHPGIEPSSPALAGGFFTAESRGKFKEIQKEKQFWRKGLKFSFESKYEPCWGQKQTSIQVFGFIYMNIAIRSKLMKHILKHLNKVSSEPENTTEKIIQIKR